MYVDIQSTLQYGSGRESATLSKVESLPSISARALNSDRSRNTATLPILSQEPERISVLSKRATSISRTSSRNYSMSGGSSINKLYERVSANLLGKFNESLLNPEYVLKKTKHQSQERQKRANTLSSLASAGTFENFLGQLTDEFLIAVEQSRSEIPVDMNEPSEEDLNKFMGQQNRVFSALQKVLEECVLGKIMAKNGLDELGKVIFSVIDTLVAKFGKVVNACKPHLKAKNLLNQHKEQQAMMVTKNEKSLFESIRLVNYLHNPLFELDERMKEKYIHDLIKNKQGLRENKTTFRIDVINNLEEDLKKIARVYTETKGMNEILAKENERLKSLIDEVNVRYEEDQKILKLKNQQLEKQKKEQDEESSSRKGDNTEPGSPKVLLEHEHDSILLTQVPGGHSMQDKSEKEEEEEDYLLKGEDAKGGPRFERAMTMITASRSSGKGKDRKGGAKGAGAETQTFVIAYLQRELKNIDGEFQKMKQELEKLRLEKAFLEKRNNDLEEICKERKASKKETGIQCKFTNEDENQGELENILDKILDGRDPLKMTAVKMDVEWLMLTVNNIYQDKFHADLIDDLEGRPRKSLREYCKEWFLNRFGFQNAAEVFMRDFVHTLNNCMHIHPRYKTFGMLLGQADAYELKLPEAFGAGGNKDESGVVREYFKRQFIMSHYGISIFNKSILTLKASKWAWNVETFLPDISNDEDALEIRGLVSVLRDVLALLNIPADDTKQILGQFDQMVEGDKYFKIIAKQFEKEKNKLVVFEEIDKGGLSVRMDFYLQFILESTAIVFIRDLERVYAQLKLSNEFPNPANVSVDLYRDAFANIQVEKPARWLDLTYDVLMRRDIKLTIPLARVLGSIVPSILSFVPMEGKIKLPEDGYPLFQVAVFGGYKEKDVLERVKKTLDIEANFNLLKVTHALVKGGLTKYQRRVGNLDYLNDLFEKDMLNIKTIIANLKLTLRYGEKEKVKHSLEQNWRRLRTIIKIKYFTPKEQALVN